MRFAAAFAVFLTCTVLVTSVDALTVRPQTIVDLLEGSDKILTGRVAHVEDGIDDGLPYTEISIEVEESFGSDLSNYTFRRFGLLEPRRTPDGKMHHITSPEGMPHYTVGERVLLFMNRPAKYTGLTSTVGIFQGKFTFQPDGSLVNDVGNVGLFEGVSLEGEARAFTSLQDAGAGLSGVQLLEFVRQAIREDWVAKGVVHNAR